LRHALEPVYEASIELFRGDPRVTAAYMSGSVGTEHEDEHSDVDPVLLIRGDEFDAFDRDLPGIFRALGVEPVLWWPERINCETLRNYAVFFQRDGELVQYDITIVAASSETKVPVRPGQVVFDKAGLLEIVEGSAPPGYSPARLRWTIEMYWIYVYILGKYIRRGDRFKLVAAQHELLQCHLEVLRALSPGVPRDWWPIMAKSLCHGPAREVCLSYLRGLDGDAFREALPAQMEQFARDARAACGRWAVEYPADFEARATKHVTAALR